MTKRSRAQPRPDPPWLDLFDQGYAESSCEAVRAAIADAANGERSSMHLTLRKHLIRPLDLYGSAHYRGEPRTGNVIAADQVIEIAERLADRFADRWLFAPEDAEPTSHRLYVAWLEFIANACGPLAYHSEPRRVRQAWDASRRFRGRAVELTPQALAAWMNQKGIKSLSQADAGELAEQYKVSQSTVYRRLKMARAAKLVS